MPCEITSAVQRMSKFSALMREISPHHGAQYDAALENLKGTLKLQHGVLSENCRPVGKNKGET